MPSLRIVTYNVHRCRGIDDRERPARIVEVLREIDADVIALQEVVSIEGRRREKDQARFIAEELGLNHLRARTGSCNGGVLRQRGALPLPHAAGEATTTSACAGCERRGCLHTDVDVAGADTVHVFNVHLGTAFLERRHQGRRLVEEEILSNRALKGPRIMLGDFNEWTRGPDHAAAALAPEERGREQATCSAARTYPGVLPFLHLDHIYFDDTLDAEGPGPCTARARR